MPDDDTFIPADVENPEVYRAALRELGDATENDPIKLSDLVPRVLKKVGGQTKASIVYRSLNVAAQDPASPIRSRKGRNGGYFSVDPVPQEEDSPPTKKEIEKEKTLEKHLWPLVALWLSQSKRIPNVSSEIANLKGGGIWSNPDVVALYPFEELGFFDVEISTVEVKPSLSQWRYFFFEAVSHKRFSERVYYVYRASTSDTEETDELKRYAEKYGVGLVELQLTAEQYESLPRWSKMDEVERTALLDFFVELMPAPFEPIAIREKIGFLRRLGINAKSDLYKFGHSL